MSIASAPMTVSSILLDIDETLTYFAESAGRVRTPRDPGIGVRNSGSTDPSSTQESSSAIHFSGVRVFADVAETIRHLHGTGFRLYTATTNASFVACAKLALAGLSDESGSPYFEGMLGGSELSPEGKTSARFFMDLLAHYKLDPKTVAHVGDDPEKDIAFAREAGIAHVIQIDRTQQEEIRKLQPTGICINRFDLLPQLLGIELYGQISSA